MLSFDVKVYAVTNLRRGKKPYQLRWKVGGERHSRTFATKTLADGRRSELMAAMRKGHQFDTETGLPAPELRQLTQPTWFEHAVAFAQMKWKRGAAKTRSSRSDALATVTQALVKDEKGAPDPAVLRRALSCWAFNFSEHQKEQPPEVEAALAWIAAKSLRIDKLDDPDVIHAALDALASKLDGTPAAANTTNRKRMVFNAALRYAVDRKLLDSNPLTSVDWTPPETDEEIDWRYVPNPRQAASLIAAAPGLGPRGEHLAAFFGCMYYAAMRPSEVTDLRVKDCTLPDQGWGELLLAGSSPRISSIWTDDGRSFEERGLKRRARKTTRPVPIPPELVQLLHQHLAKYGPGQGGRVFRAAKGGHLLSKEYADMWKLMRKAALPPELAEGPFAEVPYSLRHAGVSFWITTGVPPAEVARRAGHSVAVLYRFYAKILHGQQDRANELIEAALKELRDG